MGWMKTTILRKVSDFHRSLNFTFLIITLAQASIDEYMTMIAAGLAGASPHMISATVTAISRLVFEFKGNFQISEYEFISCL